MARSFIIQQQKSVIYSLVPHFEGLMPTNIIDGTEPSPTYEYGNIGLLGGILYTVSDELPFIMSVNGPVSLRGADQPYYLTTTKED